MAVRRTVTNKRSSEKPTFSWDTEIHIGTLATREKQRIAVNLCKKDGKGYINIVKLIKTKEDFKPTRGIAIPYNSAQQIGALIQRAFAQGKLFEFDKLEE